MINRGVHMSIQVFLIRGMKYQFRNVESGQRRLPSVESFKNKKNNHYISLILKPQTNRILSLGGIPSSLLVKDYFILIEGPFMLVPL